MSPHIMENDSQRHFATDQGLQHESNRDTKHGSGSKYGSKVKLTTTNTNRDRDSSSKLLDITDLNHCTPAAAPSLSIELKEEALQYLADVQRTRE